MTTVCTKHRRGNVDQAVSVGTGGPEAEMPVRRTKLLQEADSIVLGKQKDAQHFVSLKALDYNRKEKTQEEALAAKEDQQRRVTDMNQKHFVFGHAPPTLQSEFRGSLVAPSKEVLTSRLVRPIGGPNHKGASNLYISAQDVDRWTGDMTTTARSAYQRSADASSAAQTLADAKKHTAAMRSAHFDMGIEEPVWLSTTQQDYHPPGVATNAAQRSPVTGSAVPLAYGRRATPATHQTTQLMYGSRANERVTPPVKTRELADIGRRSNMVFGYERPDFATESRQMYKQAKFVASPTKAQ